MYNTSLKCVYNVKFTFLYLYFFPKLLLGLDKTCKTFIIVFKVDYITLLIFKDFNQLRKKKKKKDSKASQSAGVREPKGAVDN